MRFIKGFISYFTTITTTVLALVGITTAIEGYEHLSKYILFQILASGAATALITALVLCREIRSRKQFMLLSVLHYVLLCGAMIGLGVWFGWLEQTFGDIALMAFYVAVVYVFVFLITYFTGKREADAINRALKERKERK